MRHSGRCDIPMPSCPIYMGTKPGSAVLNTERNRQCFFANAFGRVHETLREDWGLPCSNNICNNLRRKALTLETDQQRTLQRVERLSSTWVVVSEETASPHQFSPEQSETAHPYRREPENLVRSAISIRKFGVRITVPFDGEMRKSDDFSPVADWTVLFWYGSSESGPAQSPIMAKKTDKRRKLSTIL